MINKKIAGAMLAIGGLAGTVGAVALSVHAQQVPTQTPVVATEQKSIIDTETIDLLKKTKSGDASEKNSGAEKTEKKDSVGGVAEKEGVETDGPGGHQDAPGAETDHQFEGKE